MSDTRREVYLALCAGYAQVRVAKRLGLSRKTVCKHTQALLHDGHIVMVNPGGNPQHYGPGPVPYEGGNKGPSGMVERGNIDLHHLKIYFPVISSPQVDPDTLEWDRVWESSGVRHYHVKNVDVEPRPGTTIHVESITYHKGSKSSLQVNLPGIVIPWDQFPTRSRQRWDDSQQVANWLARRLRCQFGFGREPEAPHHAMPPPPGISEETLRRAASMGLRNEHVRVEASNGPLEFETDEWDYLQAYMDLPKILTALAEANHHSRSLLLAQAERANITLNSLLEITRILEGHQQQLNVLARLVAGNATEPKEPNRKESEGRYIG